MSTFIKSDQSAPNLLRTSPISRSGFVHPDQRVITGLTCTFLPYFGFYAFISQNIRWDCKLCRPWLGAVWSGSALFKTTYAISSEGLVYKLLGQLPYIYRDYYNIALDKVLLQQKCINPCPAEPGYTLPLQTVQIQISWLLKKPTDLDLHCLPFSMRIYINNLNQVTWLAEN